MKIKTEFARKGHVIFPVLEDGTIDYSRGQTFTVAGNKTGDKVKPSINAAKRESRSLQGTQLGCGRVRVID